MENKHEYVAIARRAECCLWRLGLQNGTQVCLSPTLLSISRSFSTPSALLISLPPPSACVEYLKQALPFCHQDFRRIFADFADFAHQQHREHIYELQGVLGTSSAVLTLLSMPENGRHLHI